MSGDARITDPGDMDVYFIGAGGIWSRIVKNSTRDGHVGSVVSTHDANLNGLDAGSIFKIGEKEVSTAPLTTSEKADLEWIELQRARNSNCARTKSEPMNKSYVVPDNTSLISPQIGDMVRGQWEQGLTLDACPITEVGRRLLQPQKHRAVLVIEPTTDEGGNVAGSAATVPPTLEAEEACHFGERLCQKSAKDWAQLQQEDLTSRTVIEYLKKQVTVLTKEQEKGVPTRIDLPEFKRLLKQGTLVEIANGGLLLVKKETPLPSQVDRNPGQFERYLGDEPTRTYVPLLLRPWVMDQTHKEAVHLGENVTLSLLKRYYWWIGMKDSVKFWIRRCYTCQARKNPRQTVRWPLISLPLPSQPGQMVSFDLLGPLPKTTKGNTYILLMVDLFSRHAEAYALTKEEKTAELSQ